jgi:hypothetical protein
MSLEWIHGARALIYEREKGRPLTETPVDLSRSATAMAKRLDLKTIRAEELPIRRRRTG